MQMGDLRQAPPMSGKMVMNMAILNYIHWEIYLMHKAEIRLDPPMELERFLVSLRVQLLESHLVKNMELREDLPLTLANIK